MRLRAGLVLVRVVHVGHVRVLVAEPLVAVPMAVRLARRIARRVLVPVVLVMNVPVRSAPPAHAHARARGSPSGAAKRRRPSIAPAAINWTVTGSRSRSSAATAPMKGAVEK